MTSQTLLATSVRPAALDVGGAGPLVRKSAWWFRGSLALAAGTAAAAIALGSVGPEPLLIGGGAILAMGLALALFAARAPAGALLALLGCSVGLGGVAAGLSHGGMTLPLAFAIGLFLGELGAILPARHRLAATLLGPPLAAVVVAYVPLGLPVDGEGTFMGAALAALLLGHARYGEGAIAYRHGADQVLAGACSRYAEGLRATLLSLMRIEGEAVGERFDVPEES